MSNMTLREVPGALHAWLKQEAASHHRSVNKEVIALLEKMRGSEAPPVHRASFREVMEISHRASALPVQNTNSEDEILGYNGNGLPD